MANNDPVIIALQEQVRCYQRLLKLSELQHEHVRKSQTESLLEVLARRQAVLDAAAVHEAVIGPARKRWAQYLAELDAPARELAQSLLDQTRRLLEAITTSDRNDSMVLQQRKWNLGKQINKATVARQVNRNYAAAAYGRPPSHMDIKQ